MGGVRRQECQRKLITLDRKTGPYKNEAAMKIAVYLNTLRPRQNGRHFADNIFKGIFLNENIWILIRFSLKFVPKGPINNIPALVQIMAWRRPGNKPLSEPMLVSLRIYASLGLNELTKNEKKSKHPLWKSAQYCKISGPFWMRFSGHSVILHHWWADKFHPKYV